MNHMKAFTVAAFLLLLTACTTGSAIIIGNPRPAISVLEVNMYLEPPASYQTIGIVEASSEVILSDQQAQNKMILELKRQAAKIGANGVLLINAGEKRGDPYSYISGGQIYTSQSKFKAAKAKAILVQ